MCERSGRNHRYQRGSKPDSSQSESDLGEIEKEGVAGEVQQVGSRLADADVAQDAQPALIPLLLRLLRAKCTHCPREQKHLLCHLRTLPVSFLVTSSKVLPWTLYTQEC